MKLATEKAPRRVVIEILLVTGILAIIGAILFPIVGQDKGSHRDGCLSRLKQCTVVMIMYGSDNDENLPPFYTFDGSEASQKLVDATMDYAKNKTIYLCPQDTRVDAPYQEGVTGKITYVHSLTLRGVIPEFSLGKRLLKVTSIKDAATTPYMRDPIRGFGVPEPVNGGTLQDGKARFLSPHKFQFNLSYIDGHAKPRNVIDEFREL